MTMGLGRRLLDAYSQELLGEGQEILINPGNAEITKALSRVQVRTRTNRLTADEALAVFRRVAQEGHSSVHAGVMECPRSFKCGISSTVIQVARLTDSIISCAIGRLQVLPGQRSVPLVSVDPFDKHRQWLKVLISTFWISLDDSQNAVIEQTAVSAAMESAARRAWRDTHENGAERAGVKRRLQLEALFRSRKPVYVSELAVALKRIAADTLNAAGESEVTWRAFQLRWQSFATRHKRDLLDVNRQSVIQRQALADFRVGAPKHSLSITMWPPLRLRT
jgi:hypothetical protein